MEGAAWDRSATDTRLSAIGNRLVWGLIADQGQPVQQNLSASWSIDNQGHQNQQNTSASLPAQGGFHGDKDEMKRIQRTALNSSIFHNISAADCLLQYTTMFGNRSSLIMVSSDTSSPNNSLLSYGIQASRGTSAWEPARWMCRSSNTFSCKKLAAHGFQTKQEELAIADWNMVSILAVSIFPHVYITMSLKTCYWRTYSVNVVHASMSLFEKSNTNSDIL